MTAKETSELLVLPSGCKVTDTHEEREISKSLVQYRLSPTIVVEATSYNPVRTIERRLKKIDSRWYYANGGTLFNGNRELEFFRAEY